MTSPGSTDLSLVATPVDIPVLDGALPESLERLCRLAVSTTRADGALVMLLGGDRRTFTAGRMVPPWMSHDSGILMRTGIIPRAVQAAASWAAPLVLSDATAADQTALGELGVGGLLLAPMIRPDGMVQGAIATITRTTPRWSLDAFGALQDVAALASNAIGTHYALSERVAREHRLVHDAHHDALTGLPNRAVFLKRLNEAFQRMERDSSARYAVLFLDLDDFKIANDTLGHQAGDDLLVEVARRLEGCLRGGDLVARLGGDEFVMLLERVADAREVAIVADRILDAVRAPVTLRGHEWSATASIGLALSGSNRTHPEALLRAADMAMFRAKHQGRGRAEVDDRAQHAITLSRLQTETDLRRAIERDEFELHYQPIVRADDGRVTGVEALVRWRHPERGLLLPNQFVPVAEDTGLIVQLGRWVLRHAVKELTEWERRTGAPPLTLAVNLSAREFAQVDLVHAVAALLAEGGMAPDRLHLEITESTIFSQQNVAMDTVTALKALGVAIHIDDFGTGYSSLSYLQHLPIDAIKIDRTFVRGIEVEARSRHLVSSLVSLAEGIGIGVVAEGVGSAGQLHLLREMGCTWVQGFHFGRPARGLEGIGAASRALASIDTRRSTD